jgi:hypothetical protein
MSAITQITEQQQAIDYDAIAPVVLNGDLGKLTNAQKIGLYQATCQSMGLNPATNPFEYIRLNGKEKLYPKKECAEQLRKIHGVSLSGPKVSYPEGMIMCEITATLPNGRTDTDVGVVPAPKGGEATANAILKAITKAKRRVTFSILGLGFLIAADADVEHGSHQRVDIFDEDTAMLSQAPQHDWKELISLCRTTPDKLRELASAANLPPNSADLTADQALQLRNHLFAWLGTTQGHDEPVFKHHKHALSSLEKMIHQNPGLEADGETQLERDESVFTQWMIKIGEKVEAQKNAAVEIPAA